MASSHRFGEHGSVEDPDLFTPVSIGVTRSTPKITVHANPDGVYLNVATVRSELTADEIEDLIPALQEALEYIIIHG